MGQVVEARTIQGAAGRLDARLHGPERGAPVVLLHPHPRFGGTMGSRFVFDLAVALAQQGWRAVRFDYRGVGRSEGAYAMGPGEAEDAATVLDLVEQEAGQPAALVGYSFGGAVAIRAAAQRRVRRLVAVGTPLRLSECALDPLSDAGQVASPSGLVVGEHDGFVSPEDAQRLAQAFRPPARLEVVPYAGHFLDPAFNSAGVAAVLRCLAD